jgi:peroxiredoxin
VAKHIDEFRDAGAEVLAISQAKPEQLAAFLKRQPQSFPMVCDPDRVSYREFGLDRTQFWSFFRPRVIWEYLKMMAQGHRVRLPNQGEDVMQLAGDFVLNRRGEIIFAHRDRTSTDSAKPERLLQAVRDSKGASA